MTTDLDATDRDADDEPAERRTVVGDGPTGTTGAAERPAGSSKAPTKARPRPAPAVKASGGSGQARSGGGGRTASPGRQRLPWILAVLGLLGTLGFAIAWATTDDGATTTGPATGSGADATVAKAAKAFSVALTNFDGATIDRDFDKIVALSTGEFRGQADGFFSSKVRKQLKEAQASSRGEVRSAYVQSFDGTRASVFVVLDQTIANNSSPQPQADTLRMDLGLVRTKGRWLVASVDVLQAPSGGNTIGAPSADADPTGATGGG